MLMQARNYAAGCQGSVPDDSWNSYASTLYVFRYKEAIGVIRPGKLPDDVTSVALNDHGVTSAAFVTAYNPGHGSYIGKKRNLGRQARLRRAAKYYGLSFLPGAGIGIDGDYDPEASLLILGASEEQALGLGRRFGQNAVVYVETGLPAKLLCTR